ncbi:MAG TPA: sigma-54 dependent transcriptional regulator [Kofleriaceae bacterium]|nr:sigma-54 dependent transcriptional regulator [Kofleriaceae bacterium]
MTRLLVVDDDVPSCRLLAAVFHREGIEVVSAHDGRAGLARFEEVEPDAVLLDLQLPELDGIEVLVRLRERAPHTPVVMLTADRELKTAVRAIQLGAFDYLSKPIDQDELVLVVRRALERRALEDEVAELRRQVGDGGGLAAQMGPSPQIQRVIEQVGSVAATGFSVLVVGETGTGKELVAQAIHRQSDRRARPFIALDCGAIPEALLESELFGHEKGAFTGAHRSKAGQFHLAEGGTVFLDEIGNLPLALQAKLLRVLESRQLQALGATAARPFDVRFVAATNDDLQDRASQGRFRADLYFRLAQYTIALPPLRDRKADIGHLARRFLEEVRVELRRPVQEIAPDALALLERHAWPGNVRELRNMIRQAVLETDGAMLTRGALARFVVRASPRTSDTFVPARSLKETADAAARDAERQLNCDTLRATSGNKSKAARALHTDYKTLHVKMKALGIHARDFMV